jgi:hypothetical protein
VALADDIPTQGVPQMCLACPNGTEEPDIGQIDGLERRQDAGARAFAIAQHRPFQTRVPVAFRDPPLTLALKLLRDAMGTAMVATGRSLRIRLVAGIGTVLGTDRLIVFVSLGKLLDAVPVHERLQIEVHRAPPISSERICWSLRTRSGFFRRSPSEICKENPDLSS